MAEALRARRRRRRLAARIAEDEAALGAGVGSENEIGVGEDALGGDGGAGVGGESVSGDDGGEIDGGGNVSGADCVDEETGEDCVSVGGAGEMDAGADGDCEDALSGDAGAGVGGEVDAGVGGESESGVEGGAEALGAEVGAGVDGGAGVGGGGESVSGDGGARLEALRARLVREMIRTAALMAGVGREAAGRVAELAEVSGIDAEAEDARERCVRAVGGVMRERPELCGTGTGSVGGFARRLLRDAADERIRRNILDGML